MPNIESISILRKTEKLDEISQSNQPLFVTKNGKAYLVVLSTAHYEEIVKERDHYKQAFEREREIAELVTKVEKSRQEIRKDEHYTEEHFEKMMNQILS